MTIKNQEYSTFEAQKILRINRGRFVHWMRGGFIPPGRDVPWGKGYKTAYNLHDLYSIALYKQCVDFSLSRSVAKRYMEYAILKGWENIINEEIKYMLIVVMYYEGAKKISDVKEQAIFLKNDESLSQRFGLYFPNLSK